MKEIVTISLIIFSHSISIFGQKTTELEKAVTKMEQVYKNTYNAKLGIETCKEVLKLVPTNSEYYFEASFYLGEWYIINRDKKEIQDLTKVVEDNRTKAQSSVNSVTASVNSVTASVKKSIKNVDTKFDALQNDFNATKNEILSVSLEIETMKQGLLSGQDTNVVINEKIAILEQRNTALKNKVTAMEKTLNSVSRGTVPTAG